jgi:hypothetical protein
MAITKTEELVKCEVYPAMDVEDPPTENDANPSVAYFSRITFDDTDDSELPVVSNHVTYLNRYNDEGNPTDVSGYPQIIQDICAAVWTDA